MASDFSENLSGEKSHRHDLSRLFPDLKKRFNNMTADTKRAVSVAILATASVIALPFISSSEKGESPAEKNLTALLASLEGFENSTNRTPHRDVENYYVIACSAERFAKQVGDPTMTMEQMFTRVGRDDYEPRRDDIMHQSAVVVEDMLNNSYSPHPEVSEDQEEFIDKSRKNPDRTIGYIEFLAEKFQFTLPEVGLTPDRIASFQERSLQNQISSTH